MVKRVVKKTKSKKRRFQKRKGPVRVVQAPQSVQPIINIYGMSGMTRPEAPPQQQAVAQMVEEVARDLGVPPSPRIGEGTFEEGFDMGLGARAMAPPPTRGRARAPIRGQPAPPAPAGVQTRAMLAAQPAPAVRKRPACTKCGEIGHYAPTCPNSPLGGR